MGIYNFFYESGYSNTHKYIAYSIKYIFTNFFIIYSTKSFSNYSRKVYNFWRNSNCKLKIKII